LTFAPRWISWLFGRGACLRGALAACLCAGPVTAQDWSALVVGDTGDGAGRAFADAYYAAEALRGWTQATPMLLRNARLDAVEAALTEIQGQQRLVIYFAGPMSGTAPRIDGAAVPLTPRVAPLAAAGLREVLVLVENCAGAGAATALPDLEVAAEVTLILASSAVPGAACPPTGQRLSDVLKVAAASAQAPDQSLRPFLRRGQLEELSDLSSAPASSAAPAAGASVSAVADPAPAHPREQVTITDVVRITPVGTPVSTPVSAPASVAIQPAPNGGAGAATAALTPVRAPASSSATAPAQGGGADGAPVVIFSPVNPSQLAAVPQADGLPEPSIIVGLIEEGDANFAAALDTVDLSGSEISYDDVTARNQLRGADPELYASLLEAGAFDPPGPVLVQALQQELARMGCYTSRIDGAWGPGSQGAVRRYYAEVGSPVLSLAAEIPLFRDIVSRADVTCAAPVAAARPRSSTPTATRQPAASSGTSAPANTPAQTQIAPGAALGGVFR